jgi:Arc/MetJ-type ribon-helix-helix transcriptional regulator
MNVTLPTELENYIAESVRSGAFASASDFVEAAARRQMQEEAWSEQKVMEGLEGPVTPLTREDLDSVRNLVRQSRARQTGIPQLKLTQRRRRAQRNTT